MKKLWAFLDSFNPLSIYRAERERDREVLIAIVREVSGVLQMQFQITLEQQKLMTQFLGNFKVDDTPPRSWSNVGDQVELERLAQSLGLTVDDYLKSL